MNSQKPVHFSDYFNIDKEKLKELGVFDPILNFDTKVFVEPLLLRESSSPIIKNSYQNYKKFFATLLILLQKSGGKGDKCWRVAKKMVNFPEYEYTCIGYSSGDTQGNGSGLELNDQILQSAIEIVEKAEGNPDIFLLLPLLEEGIAGDRISDMAQRIIDEDICQYTKDIMDKLGVEGNCAYITKNFNSYTFLRNPFSRLPIKLLPKDILLNLPVADDIDSLVEEMTGFNQNLRDIINRDIGDIWYETTKKERKAVLLKELKTNKEFFIETLKALKEYSFEHYDLEKDSQGLYRWLKDSQDFINVELSKEVKSCPDNLDALGFAINSVIHHFRDMIENKEMWRMFWTKYGSEYKHVRVLYSQMLFFMVCNTWLTSQDSNIKIKLKHTLTNMDLEFSISGKNRLVIHIRHGNNPSLLKGYKAILESYRNAPNERHYYLVMNFKEEVAEQLTEVKIIENPICKLFEVSVAMQKMQKDKKWSEAPDFEIPNFEFDIDELKFSDELLAFEGIELCNAAELQSKGGKSRHSKTTLIKTEVIKPMFLHRRKSGGTTKVSEISNAIIQELNALEGHNDNSLKVLSFMNKYAINDYKYIEKTIDYLRKNNDGGQIPKWCYQASKGKI